jgi:Transposase
MHMTVGVDTGRRRHQAAVYGPATERIMGQVGFAVDRAGFDEFRGYLERRAPQPDQLVIGLEATGQYHLTLVEYLVGYQVARLNPSRRPSSGALKASARRPTDWMPQAFARFLALPPRPSQCRVDLLPQVGRRADRVAVRVLDDRGHPADGRGAGARDEVLARRVARVLEVDVAIYRTGRRYKPAQSTLSRASRRSSVTAVMRPSAAYRCARRRPREVTSVAL